jgi:hypothetical protein
LLAPTVTKAKEAIIESRDAPGFGFVELGNANLFLPWREFVESEKAPEVGNQISDQS